MDDFDLLLQEQQEFLASGAKSSVRVVKKRKDQENPQQPQTKKEIRHNIPDNTNLILEIKERDDSNFVYSAPKLKSVPFPEVYHST